MVWNGSDNLQLVPRAWDDTPVRKNLFPKREQILSYRISILNELSMLENISSKSVPPPSMFKTMLTQNFFTYIK